MDGILFQDLQKLSTLMDRIILHCAYVVILPGKRFVHTAQQLADIIG